LKGKSNMTAAEKLALYGDLEALWKLGPAQDPQRTAQQAENEQPPLEVFTGETDLGDGILMRRYKGGRDRQGDTRGPVYIRRRPNSRELVTDLMPPASWLPNVNSMLQAEGALGAPSPSSTAEVQATRPQSSFRPAQVFPSVTKQTVR
jgi:hypothetical protein